MPEQPTLFPVLTVHCAWCVFKVEGPDPDENHDRMETHYREKHVVHTCRGTRWRGEKTGWQCECGKVIPGTAGVRNG